MHGRIAGAENVEKLSTDSSVASTGPCMAPAGLPAAYPIHNETTYRHKKAYILCYGLVTHRLSHLIYSLSYPDNNH